MGIALSYVFSQPQMGEFGGDLLGSGVFLVVAWVGLWYPLDLLFIAREQANRDVEDALDFYLAEDAELAALGFIDALQKAYAHIGRHPATGSPRYAHELNLPGLRFWPLKRYPYLVFYVEREGMIDVWRVLHTARDLPAWMSPRD